jgi:branched-chain amino acid transport system substrate-binding protein
MKSHIFGRKSVAGVLATFAIASIAAACGSSSSTTATTAAGKKTGFTGTVTVAESTTLSGSISELGQGGLQGVQDAVANINAHGWAIGEEGCHCKCGRCYFASYWSCKY